MMWQPIATAPKDRAILLWFPDGDFACRASWECIEGGDEDGTGSTWAWLIPDDFSEQHDGVVWSESAQPTLWTDIPTTVATASEHIEILPLGDAITRARGDR